jgi:hypothetical protein
VQIFKREHHRPRAGKAGQMATHRFKESQPGCAVVGQYHAGALFQERRRTV